jgi:hypothetical protein
MNLDKPIMPHISKIKYLTFLLIPCQFDASEEIEKYLHAVFSHLGSNGFGSGFL